MSKIIRGTHSSPGVYTEFNDISYSVNTMGVTTLGLVGETLKGPAFEPIAIQSWNEFKSYFGGTSAELFKDTLYPKYEAPYIAKSYLSKADQLYMCRVLGLSGYNAGKAYVITASSSENSDDKYVIAVLRSRGSHKKYYKTINHNNCTTTTDYDKIIFDCEGYDIELKPTLIEDSEDLGNCMTHNKFTSVDDIPISVDAVDFGSFDIVLTKKTFSDNTSGDTSGDTSYSGGTNGYIDENVIRYSVSLNAGSENYIYKVLGSDPNVGSAKLIVEEVYDYYMLDLIREGKIDHINFDVSEIGDYENEYEIIDINGSNVSGMVSIPLEKLTKKNVQQIYLCDKDMSDPLNIDQYRYYEYNESTKTIDSDSKPMELGHVYQVVKAYFTENKLEKYVYLEINDASIDNTEKKKAIYVAEYNSLFTVVCNGGKKRVAAVTDITDYRSRYRCATTPWFISNLIGKNGNYELRKLFRFHTITDGNSANTEIKVSIANIKPEDETFDVYIRNFYDTDSSPEILESYKNVTLTEGKDNYIGLRIGTYDGEYPTKSSYVLLEMAENDNIEGCYPCGFTGYPTRNYEYAGLISPDLSYNTVYDNDIRDNRQYFGMSDITGVDEDILSYKGEGAYTEEWSIGYTGGFHLDSRLNSEGVTVKLDGINVTGLFSTPSPNYSMEYTNAPIITKYEQDMEGSLFENVKLRKFTAYPFGGFDGWDIYRKSRTTLDEFKAQNYKGDTRNGGKGNFTQVTNAYELGLTGKTITSDYYAFKTAAYKFQNPEEFSINLFATPGIDYVNNKELVNDIIYMLEEMRGDTFYVTTTPDKPMGASDDKEEMYTASEAASNLENSNIDTYYASTYFPWVKYYDKDNSKYINLPATKDVLRNMADVDNKRFPWIAPAGLERGNVECTKMHYFAKLDDEDVLTDARINPLKTFSSDGVKVWGAKTLYTGNTPMNRINVVRLMLYLRKLVIKYCMPFVFDQNDATVKNDVDKVLRPILTQIKADRGITDFRLIITQTPEMMDAHEIRCAIKVKPTPILEFIEVPFDITPQGIEFDD